MHVILDFQCILILWFDIQRLRTLFHKHIISEEMKPPLSHFTKQTQEASCKEHQNHPRLKYNSTWNKHFVKDQ